MSDARNSARPRLADSLTPEMLDLTHELSSDIRAIIEHSSGGVITFGQFAALSMNGTNNPGFYSNPFFTPNNLSALTGSFNTSSLVDRIGQAIGERSITQLFVPEISLEKNLRIAEFGGGDGRLMCQFLDGIKPTLIEKDTLRLETLSVDTTKQLLERQEVAITRHTTGMRSAGIKVFSAFVQDSVTTYEGGSNNTGIVFSNELLDMLPFEMMTSGKILCVKNGDSGFEYTYQEPPEDLKDTVAAIPTAEANETRIIQPSLTKAMDTMYRQIGQGILLVMDYRPGDNHRVRLMRGGVSLDTLDELRYPGLIDISIKPDWTAVGQWAKTKQNIEEISAGNINDLIDGSPLKDIEAAIRQLHEIFLLGNPTANPAMTAEQRRGYIMRYKVLLHSFWHMMFRKEAPN